MKTFGDLKAGDKIFSFNKNNRKIFIDEIIYIWFHEDRIGLKCRPILSADECIPEFCSFIENKYLDKFYMESASSFISADEKLFFDYINENV